MRFFEEIEIGHRRDIGAYTFTAESIKAFAAKFDPQRFHLDEEEGKNSLFGGLAASGWHVGSACMSLLVADGQRLAREAAARGEEVAAWGPSPGFRDLRWIKPVLAGDTISYSNVVIDKRISARAPAGASSPRAPPAPTSVAKRSIPSPPAPSFRCGTAVRPVPG